MIWDNSDWIAAVSALITLIALVVAFSLGIRSIRETRNIQRREYRNSLLNEITQWATRVIDWRYENRTALTQASGLLEVRQNQRFLFLHLVTLRLEVAEESGDLRPWCVFHISMTWASWELISIVSDLTGLSTSIFD